ncbi:MAG TPA: DUF2254 family protein [Chloroflexota bacterium]|nr:DUF2254 family protein [Chloroflexota bacterium]
MRPGNRVFERTIGSLGRAWTLILQAMSQFLLIPTIIVVFFLLLAVLTFFLDAVYSPPILSSVRALMQHAVFRSSSQTSGLLGTLAGSLITVTSITFSFLILAVQGSAMGMTNAVLTQFLERGLNQVVFGYFIGLAIYTLIVLSTVSPFYNPVWGGTFAVLLTLVALLLLPILFYSTIYQMHPASIVAAVHNHTLKARERERRILDRTRRASQLAAPVQYQLRGQRYGFVTNINLDRLEATLRKRPAITEIVFCVAIGSSVGFNQVLAEIRSTDAAGLDEFGQEVERALSIDRVRDFHADPDFGIEQIRTIGWTSSSTAKQNPPAALACVNGLADILARWLLPPAESGNLVGPALPIVVEDGVLENCLDALAAIATIATKGSQYQTFVAVLDAIGDSYPLLPPSLRDRAEDVVRQILPDVDRQMQTAELERALANLADALARNGQPSLARNVRQTGRKNRPATDDQEKSA